MVCVSRFLTCWLYTSMCMYVCIVYVGIGIGIGIVITYRPNRKINHLKNQPD